MESVVASAPGPGRLGRSLAAFAVAALLAGCGGPADEPLAIVEGGDDDGMAGAVLATPYVVPEAALTDTDGTAYSLVGDTDRPLTLVFFGYTHCPDVCQVVMATLASAMTRLEEEQRDRVDVVLVTTDPARDDPATLRAYLDRFDPAFVGVTGDLSRIQRVARRLGVFVERGARLPGGGYEVSHSTPVLGITSDDRAPIVWTQGTSAVEFAHDITRLLRT